LADRDYPPDMGCIVRSYYDKANRGVVFGEHYAAYTLSRKKNPNANITVVLKKINEIHSKYENT
jgi:hypothetical protein